MGLVRRAMPVPTAREEYELCANHLRRLAAVGLTGTHAMDGTLASLERLRALESRGDLVTRILVPFTIEPDTPEEMWEAYAAAGGEHGRCWRAGVAKFFIDGVIPGYGADVTVMADDPIEVDGDELVSLPVLLTVVDGEVVFRGL